MTRRRITVVSRYRDEDGEVRDHDLAIDVGSDALEPDDRTPSYTEIMAGGEAVELPGDWIPFAHVPLELLPDDDFGPSETERLAIWTGWSEWSDMAGRRARA